MNDFSPVNLVPLLNGGEAKVVKKLGEGDRRMVYLAEYQGEQYMLHWYRKGRISENYAIQLQEALFTSLKLGDPGRGFLWPLFLTAPSEKGFGYLQRPLPEGYVSFGSYLRATTSFQNTGALISAGLNLVIALRSLHQLGLEHQNLDSSSFFMRMEDGDVLIWDCHNIVPYGQSQGIFGTIGYVAPEIIRDNECMEPDDYPWSPDSSPPRMKTYRYSSRPANKHTVAVLLFRLLVRSDPLEGKKVVDSVCLTEYTERLHYSEKPIFIFDPKDESNRPVPGVHNNAIRFWPLLPDYIQEAFTKVFTEGLTHPEKRLPMSAWEKLLARMKDDLVTCPDCQAEAFASMLAKEGNNNICPNCDMQIHHG